MKSILFVTTLSVMLAACSGGGGGGGGGGSDGGTTPLVGAQTQPAASQQLGAYVGTWVADCSDHELEYATITRVSDDAVKIASKVDYYSGAGCTGSVIGTQTDTGDVPATYVDTANASIVLPPATSPVSVKVDRFTATIPSYSLAVSGPGVTRVTKDGVPQWCMTFDDGNTVCIHDKGTQAGGSSNGAFYLQGDQLAILNADGAGFTVGQRLTRK